MSNVSIYHKNILGGGSTVSATNVESLSSAAFAHDDRLSFSFTTTAQTTTFQIDQPSNNVREWRYLAFAEHTDLAGGTAIVKTYPTVSRVTPTVVISGTIPSDSVAIMDAGSTQNAQFIDVELTASGSTMSFGEMLLATKFDSPQRPGLGIETDHVPRRSFISLPNGERSSIKHAETVRIKRYNIPGMTLAQADTWSDLFDDGEGKELVILVDDREEIYPALMNQQITVTDNTNIVSIGLEFTEIKLS